MTTGIDQAPGSRETRSRPTDTGAAEAALDRLLAPDTTASFLCTAWERAPLHAAHGDPDYLDGVFTTADLDRLLATTPLPPGRLNLAQDGVPFDATAYVRDGLADPAKVRHLHELGATIIVRAVEQWHPGLGRLARAVGASLGTTTQANVYATPAGGRSTPPHWDTHDLLVLQVHGEKRWRLFESDRPLPLGDERFTDALFTVGPERETIVLRPGDVLYLPRGTIHEPSAETYSIHVSLGLVPVRMADVVAEVVALAATSACELRRALPPRGAADDLAIENAVLAALRMLVNRDLVRAALGELSHRPDDGAADVGREAGS